MDGDIVASFVDNIDDESVAIVNFQGRTRVLPVHRDGVVGVAQPLHFGCLNLFPSERSSLAMNEDRTKLNVSQTQDRERDPERKRATYDKIMVVNFCICQCHCHREEKESSQEERGFAESLHGFCKENTAAADQLFVSKKDGSERGFERVKLLILLGFEKGKDAISCII